VCQSGSAEQPLTPNRSVRNERYDDRYHLAVAEAAYARGHQVYLIDPYRLSYYRAGLGRRAKTDRQDAQLLDRYAERESGELRAWTPLKPGEQRFWRLLRRRAALVRCKVQLDQSLGGLDVLQEEAEELVAHCEQMIRKLDRALLGEAKQLGWGEWIERCQGIPGVGPLTAMALVASWRRGEFRSVDAFIAFLGWSAQFAVGAVLSKAARAWSEQHGGVRGVEPQAGQGQLRLAADQCPVRSNHARKLASRHRTYPRSWPLSIAVPW
jgi:transposase